MYIVVKMQGKGHDSSADFVSVHILHSYEDAQYFINANTNTGKYWCYCEIVNEGQNIETFPEFFE